MKGLLLKDWYTLTRQLKLILAMLVFFSILPGYSTVSFALVYAAMLPITALAYDERSKWDELAAMMPYSARQIVAGKYLLGILSIAGAVLISSVVQFITGLIRADFAAQEVMLMVLFTAFLAVILMSVNLPIMYAFGVEKGRILFMVVCGVIAFAGIGLANTMVPKLGQMDISPISFVLIIVAAMVILFLSLQISVRLYRRKNK